MEGALSPRVAGLLVFLSGAAVLVLEIVSLRLLAPYVGLTLEASTSVIGVALTAIAVGAWAGGRAADAADPARLLGPALVLAGALTTLTVPAVRWAGAAAAGRDPSMVLLVAAVAVFVPAALLSAVPPLVVKLGLRDLGHTGRVVGRLSGIGTLGAILATFGTGFFLLAALPSSTILLGLGILLVLAGLGFATRRPDRLGRDSRPGSGGPSRGAGGRLPPALLGLAAIAVPGTPLTLLAPRPCGVETAYHCARVVADPARPSGRVLELDTLRHSYVDLADPTHLKFRYIRAMAATVEVVLGPGPLRALYLGGGGFTLPRYLAATRPGSVNTVLEIDPGVVDLDRRELDLRLVPAGEPGISVEVGDARTALGRQPPGGFDLVVGDAFGGVAVPWHLTTREVAEQVRDRLAPGGVYVLNVIDHAPNGFAKAELATLRAVFDSVAVLAPDGSGGNFVAIAANAPLPLNRLGERFTAAGISGRLLGGPDLDTFLGGAPVLTDDYAPVDQLLTPYPSRR